MLSTSPERPANPTIVGLSAALRLALAATACVVVAEFAGPVTVPLGGKLQVVLSPFLWALFLGAAWGAFSPRLPRGARVGDDVEILSAAVLQPALLLFIAKLGLLVGGALPRIMSSGFGLVFQEFGHFFGTMVFGLPVALLLGIKREAIGATFSVGREPSLAIIAQKYGMSSPEGHGVLAEYLTGTVFGTIFIALFAGVVTSLGIFHPNALAMGAGVGSGSMMAAASGAIAAQQTPEAAKEVAAFAAASNLITTTVGTYFTLFLSLPFTIWAYGILEPILGRVGRRGAGADVLPEAGREVAEPHVVLPGLAVLAVWVVTGVVALLANLIAFGTVPAVNVIEGMAIILGTVITGYSLYRMAGGLLPAVLFVSIIAMALTYPGFPYAGQVAALTGKINFLSLATPVIALAGLSIARNLPVFRRLGWRIVVVSLCANAGTFLGATLIAEYFARQG